ncbi:hypothetical protein MNEG_16152 [Monoraphidium neglectum]|uniref:Uncharacterized protein n=1 Tax=Monoraphidium neglectum TaxID=145388 RepID=A0A0D2LP78_9CHLO|nr:hypothetical protein MNEG_16152 [Monoraphidium neglectum]KIY91811.1 hypothetical protein MNEG_16152 [Monoraphidium neglectum]|eukprot:XP_013890831.1 hypothetical protein MNEG_16152 [Monoraphidium neglectum]
MCAPTGRAAQRLQEIVGYQGLEASTIHRLLGYKGGRRDKATAAAAAAGDDAAEGVALEGGAERGLGGSGGADDVAADVDEELDLGSACTHNKHRPLPYDCVLLDEASMMDLPLAAALLNAIE